MPLSVDKIYASNINFEEEYISEIEKVTQLDKLETEKTTFGGELVPMMASGCTSVNQMQQMVLRGQAPAGVTAVHGAHIPGCKPHIHFETGALNYDGTVHDGIAPNLTNAQRNWITSNGWSAGNF